MACWTGETSTRSGGFGQTGRLAGTLNRRPTPKVVKQVGETAAVTHRAMYLKSVSPISMRREIARGLNTPLVCHVPDTGNS